MRFYVVEDDPTDYAMLVQALGQLYKDATIGPASTFGSWEEAQNAIRTQTDPSERLAFIMDLAIPSGRHEVAKGVDVAYEVKCTRPACSFIAYTMYPHIAKEQHHFNDTFQGLIDKGEFCSLSREKRPTFLAAMLGEALKASAPDTAIWQRPVSEVDSIGLRLFKATFGDNTTRVLVADTVPDWERVEVSAPSQGHSGSFVIRLEGIKDGCQQALIVKCAQDRQKLENELNAPAKWFPELGGLASLMHFMDPKPERLSNGRGYYYRQVAIAGADLLEILCAHGWNDHARAALAQIVTMEEDHCKQPKGSYARDVPTKQFTLTETDVQRANTSLPMLEALAKHTKAASFWPTDLPNPPDLCAGTRALILKWNEMLSQEHQFFYLAQHGDLHPRNVMVHSQDRVELIDPARLGRWPVGYDLARLAAVTRVRFIDNQNYLDWVERDVRKWDGEGFCVIDADVAVDACVCPPAVYCDQAFRRVVQSRPKPDQALLFRSYLFGTIFDLIKVMSYQDLSPYKRMWVLVNCWRLGSRAGCIT